MDDSWEVLQEDVVEEARVPQDVVPEEVVPEEEQAVSAITEASSLRLEQDLALRNEALQREVMLRYDILRLTETVRDLEEKVAQRDRTISEGQQHQQKLEEQLRQVTAQRNGYKQAVDESVVCNPFL